MKRALSVILCLSILSSSAWSDETAPAKFTLNPETIRHQLLESNLSITQALNQVHDAKDQVSVARGNLLPSINVGGLLTLSGGATFALTSVQFLLPFLMPSNWFDYFQQKDLFQSELLSYKILELNVYSSALALYFTTLNDLEVQSIYAKKHEDLKTISELTQKEAFLGFASESDVQQTEAQAQMAFIQMSQLNQLVKQDVAAMRVALGLPVQTQLIFESESMPESEWEKVSEKEIQTAIDQSLKVAPEYQQIQYLIQAARHGEWSAVFSFINSSSLSYASSSSSAKPENVTFESPRGSTSGGLGFSYYPTIKLSQRNTEKIRLLETQLIQQNTSTLETSLYGINESLIQFNTATRAENNMKQFYQDELKRYDLGFAPYLNVLIARTQLADASLARVRANLGMNLIRTTLHRTMITDEFAKIRGCQIKSSDAPRRGFFGWLKSLGGTTHKTLDQVCREGGGPNS